MFISVFDVFKIGIGPSSSHTIGPMVAAARFLSSITPLPEGAARIQVRLHGSLAFTGKGHATDRAIFLGLMGAVPAEMDPEDVEPMLERLARDRQIRTPGGAQLSFDPETDLIFDFGPALPLHSNGMVFQLLDAAGAVLSELVLYSIGGGFIASADEIGQSRSGGNELAQQDVPYPFPNAATMLEMGKASGLTIAQMKWANECAARPDDEVEAGLDRIWAAMDGCINRGLKQDGILPGRLKVKRRARGIHEKLLADQGNNSPFKHTVMDWLGVYAMAVNEENAAGGRVVTAPTNGAAGVIPAVIRYYLDHCPDANQAGIRTFLLTAAAIGGIIKANASISGAEVGCQGEVGSASAMAAAGLCAALGGTNEQIENAAEIALEHHLGMTCDPIAGLVQVPCIERNAVGAVKAVTAASLALRGDGTHFVPLDGCIETMRQTGLDMTEKYKETSTGGLAVNIVEC
ncbi:L-serine ammonia-lyase [Microvirga tunisiensis]|uniref:L-serine dehydratase n=2 Tax=Pannonibacter tanglangensis TaxID=2750084 RepID=A0A7X5F3J2_9HYPH|nr:MULTISPECIES: L-serine ammonia-lyase [unclassified Pannonibacter]NBN64597.1 L-serine ammonia-lyase [Pannonibacter sp. XCT-34]NBN79132.1 L-serine ammonia-lyase [Pannonibacter sp. XCT-53]